MTFCEKQGDHSKSAVNSLIRMVCIQFPLSAASTSENMGDLSIGSISMVIKHVNQPLLPPAAHLPSNYSNLRTVTATKS